MPLAADRLDLLGREHYKAILPRAFSLVVPLVACRIRAIPMQFYFRLESAPALVEANMRLPRASPSAISPDPGGTHLSCCTPNSTSVPLLPG